MCPTEPIGPIGPLANGVFVSRTDVSERVHRRPERDPDERHPGGHDPGGDPDDDGRDHTPAEEIEAALGAYDDHGRAARAGIAAIPPHPHVDRAV